MKWLRGMKSRRNARRGGMRRRLVVALVLLLIVVALLPTIVARSPLRNWVLGAISPDDRLQITAENASLGWFSGVAASGVKVTDRASGQTVLAVESFQMNRPTLALLSNPRDLGEIEVVRPVVYLAMRSGGSNWEEFLSQITARFTEREQDPPGDRAPAERIALRLRVVDGVLLIDDLEAKHRWRTDQVDLQYAENGAAPQFDELSVRGNLVDLGSAGASEAEVPAGGFSLAVTLAEGGRRQASWQAEGFSLAVVQPWVRRSIADAELTGSVVGSGSANWLPIEGAFPSDLTTTGTLTIEGLDATAPFFRGDRVQLARVDMPWQLASQPVGIVIREFQLTSDVGRVAARGVLDAGQLGRLASAGATLDAIATHDVELQGEIDLVRLAAMLPHALYVREDTRITGGGLEFAARQQPAQGGQLVTGSIRTANLAGMRGGRPISWAEPISARFQVSRVNGLTTVDALQCDSEFLTAKASGTPSQFGAEAKFDLSRLAAQLGQFVDLDESELGGSGTAKVGWRLTDGENFAASASGELAQFRMALGDGKVWTEPQLVIRAEATGTIDALTHRVARIATGRAELDSGGDSFESNLLAPVDLTFGSATWPVSVRATGNLGRWLTRIRPWYALAGWEVDGEGDLTAAVRVGARSGAIKDAKLSLANFRATSAEWNIVEPRVEVSGDASWDGVTGEFVTSTAQLVTSTAALKMGNVRVRAVPESSQALGQLNGVVAFRTDLARLAAWRNTGGERPDYLPSGSLEGTLRFDPDADGVRGEISATGTNVALAQVGANGAAQTIWQEPQVALRGLATYQRGADRLAFRDFHVQSRTLQAMAGGQIERLSTVGDANLQGTLDYDLAQITPLLKPYLVEGITLTGREQARFSLRGPLFDGAGGAAVSSTVVRDPYRVVSDSARLAPSATIPWSRRLQGQFIAPWGGANVYGLGVGPGRLSAVLGEGAIRIEPLSLAIGEGTLTLAPTVRLDPEPAELTLPQGPIITNVRISPEVSEAMLKYVAPVLAGATQSEGLFSMEIDGARIPLGEARRSAAQGRLSVHSVRVTPGPLAQQWVSLARQIEALARSRDASAPRSPVTLLSIRDQGVNFRVVNERVYHDQMEFMVDDVVLRSQGSVGFDETLALTVEVPIQDKWVEGQKLLVGLKGQSLTIPVGGTLSRPQMDSRAVASLSQQLIQSAAQQAIGGELNKALEKLFKSK